MLYVLQRAGYVRRIPASERSGKVQLLARSTWPNKDPSGIRGQVLQGVIRLTSRHSTAGSEGETASSAICPLSPERLSRQLELSREQLIASLRALDERGYLRWSPPERIGGVELLRAGEPLAIDESDLDARRERELAKVSLMMGYARAACRRRYLLEYFGQTAPWQRCGTCDQCVGGGTTQALASSAPLNEQQRVVVQKLLSCVARMERQLGQQDSARYFSPGLICDVAKGTESSRVSSFGFQRLPSFGNLSDWSSRDVQSLLDEVLHAGGLHERYTTREINGRKVTYKEVGLNDLSWENSSRSGGLSLP